MAAAAGGSAAWPLLERNASEHAAAIAQWNTERGVVNVKFIFMRRPRPENVSRTDFAVQYFLCPRYFFTVNGTENCVLSHISLITPPPSGFLATAIVN